MSIPAPSEPATDRAVVDLLGLLAYAELIAFAELAATADRAPDPGRRALVSRLAASELVHHESLRSRLEALGVDPDEAMLPFVSTIDAFHARTTPTDWLEGLVKAYVGDGIAGDFYAELAGLLGPAESLVIRGVVADLGARERDRVVVEQVRAASAADPRVTGRLALWARRIMGEALSQAQQAVVAHESLASVLVATSDRPGRGADLAEIGRMFARIADEHRVRMERLGLTA